MSVFEFQVSSTAYLALQRNLLRSLRLCRPTPFAVGGVDIVLDRIDFGANSLRHEVPDTFTHDFAYFRDIKPESVDGFRTQIVQDVTVHVATWQSVLAHPNAQPDLVAATLRLIFDVNFFTNGDDECHLNAQLNSLEPTGLPALPPSFGVLLDDLMVFVTTEVRKLLPAASLPVNLAGALPAGIHIANAGLSVDDANAVVAFRFELAPPSSLGNKSWQNFHSGFFHNHLEGNGFSFYIDAAFIEEAVKVQINQALAEIDVDELDTRVGCHYSNAGGKATFTIDVLAMYDLPDPLPDPQLHPAISVALSVPEANVVQADADFTGIVVLVQQFVGLIGWFLPGLVDPIEALLQAQVGSSIADVNEDGDLGFVSTTPDFHLIAKRRVRVPSPLTGADATVTTILAQERGIAVAGALQVHELTSSSLGLHARGLKIAAPRIDCGSAGMSLVAAFKENQNGFAVIHGQAGIDEDGTVPTFLCDLRVVNDPLGVFPRNAIRVDRDETPIVISYDFVAPPDSYFDNPYPCDVIAVTTSGTRLIRLDAPPRFTRKDADRLVAELLVALGDCQILTAPWYLFPRGYNPRWSIDPTPELDIGRIWQLDIVGMQPGEVASVSTEAGREIARSSARAGAPVRLSVLTSPAAGESVSIRRTAGAAPMRTVMSRRIAQTDAAARAIAVGQQNLERLADVPLYGSLRQLVATNFSMERGVYAVQENAVSLFSLDVPSRPVLVQAWRTAGVRGAMGWRGGLLLFGDRGFTLIRDGVMSRVREAGCLADPVLGAVVSHDIVYALRDDRLDFLNIGEGCLAPIGTEPFSALRSVARCGNTLLLAVDERLLALDLTDRRKPNRRAQTHGADIRALSRPAALDPASVLAQRSDGSASVVSIIGDELVETSRYAETPWFAGSVRLGAILVRPGRGGYSLSVHRFGAATSL